MRPRLSNGAGIAIAFILGLLIASTGTATAAKLITGKDIKNGTIKQKDLAAGVRAKLGRTGAPGPKGEPGPSGPKGEPGPSYAVAGTVASGSAPDLTGYSPSSWKQSFKTPDSGPVQVASTVTLSLSCGGSAGVGYNCGIQYALAIDGKPVRGTLWGYTSFTPGSSNRELTLFGVMDNLPAGDHELRLYAKKLEGGGAVTSIGSTPWSFSVLRVGAVG